jgi:ribosome biogenesis GTPase
MQASNASGAAVVVAHYGIAVAVRFAAGDLRRIRLRRGTRVVVGDRVEVEEDSMRVLEATGVLRRRDSHGRVRAVAANLDALGIVLAARPASPIGFVDRAIVAARAEGLESLIVVNKADLPGASDLVSELRAQYSATAKTLVVSAQSGMGLDKLNGWLAEGRRGVFVGTSGVGKSSILNALLPELELAVGEINDDSGLGRHITSTATLHALPGGGELIDTPGFRDFGPVEVSSRELATFFPGFEFSVDAGCHFRDCLHRSEPGCGVLEAVAGERIPEERHAAYLTLLEELIEVERSARGG